MESLNIRAITWNVEGTNKPEDFDCSQLLGFDHQNVDVFVVGFQEMSCRVDNIFIDILFNGEDPWSKAVREELAGLDFVKVISKRYFGTVISLFVLRKHLCHLRKIESQYQSLALDLDWYAKNTISDLVGRKIGSWPRAQKGAVSIRFELYSKAFCFVCTHLEAHDHKLDVRIRQYSQVEANHGYKSKAYPKILDHDYVLWMGDLNFRLEGEDLSFDKIVADISDFNLEKLLKFDQLKESQRKGKAFSVFLEDSHGPRFPPSYKFKIGTNVHDRKRSPAWTDRILYYLNDSVLGSPHENSIKSSNYVAHHKENFYCSDHRPVSCDFTTNVNSFSELQEIKMCSRMRFFPDDKTPLCTSSDDNVRILNISYDIPKEFGHSVNSWDWIGLYKRNFTSINDYSSFTWASEYPKNSSVKTCTIRSSEFKTQYEYILLYVSTDFSILGISDCFKIE